MENRNNTEKLLKELLSPYGEPPENSEIELTEEEINEAINLAKVKKGIREENERRERLRDEFNKQLMTPFTTKELSEYVLQYARATVKDFQINDGLKPILNALCFYFTSNPQFEKMSEGWALNKGLFMWGNVGVGKTTLMNIFRRNKRQCFQIVSCRKFASEYAKYGEDVIEPYRNTLYSIPSSDNFLQKQMGVCFDDLGTERDAVNYGNRKNIMEEIILDRYDNKVPYPQTHITTNLSVEEIEERYGTRVRSRMREMFNMIELDGNDLRK